MTTAGTSETNATQTELHRICAKVAEKNGLTLGEIEMRRFVDLVATNADDAGENPNATFVQKCVRPYLIVAQHGVSFLSR